MALAGDDVDKICDIVNDILLHDTPLYVDEYAMTDIRYSYNMVLESILDAINYNCCLTKKEMINKIAKRIHDQDGEEIDGYED